MKRAWVYLVSTWMIADMEKVLMAWMEEPSSHNIPLSQNLIQSKSLEE